MEFEVKLDQMFKDYVMATGLEIFFFDDAAPLMETEQKDEISDMIGTANIDLSPLLKGEPISKTVLIKDLKNRDCGSVTVIIGIRDFKVVWQVKQKQYSPEWEDEFILKVCVELVKGIKDPTLEKAFDELSKHRKSIHREDFYTAVTKWFWADVQEYEVNMFIELGSAYRGQPEMTADNFVKYFSTPFNLALRQF